MKNDKFCVSKTLAYLVALVVVVVGGFYVMNYANSQKLGSAPRASESGWNKAKEACKIKTNLIAEKADNNSWCRYFTGTVRGTFPNPIPDKYGSFCNVAYSADKSVCTPAVGQSIGSTTAAASCTANQIVEVIKSRGIITACRFQTGGKSSSGRCVVNYSDDDTACAAGVGATFTSPAAPVLGCRTNIITEVGRNNTGTITWCRYETGNKSGNRCTVGYSDDDTACAAGVGNVYEPSAALSCTTNKIVEVGKSGSSITWCRYETGNKRANGTCILGYSDDDTACAAGVGREYVAAATPGTPNYATIKALCEGSKDLVVSGTVTTNKWGGKECKIYDGKYKMSGDINAPGTFCTVKLAAGADCL